MLHMPTYHNLQAFPLESLLYKESGPPNLFQGKIQAINIKTHLGEGKVSILKEVDIGYGIYHRIGHDNISIGLSTYMTDTVFSD